MVLVHENSKRRFSKIYHRGFLGTNEVVHMNGTGIKESAGKYAKKAAQFAVRQGKVILPSILKAIAPELISYAGSKASQKLSKAGLSDDLVNKFSKGTQYAANRASKANVPELSNNQQAVSNFLSGQSKNLLQDILSKGNGVSRIGSGQGSGVARYGNGVSRIGSGQGQGVSRYGSGVSRYGSGAGVARMGNGLVAREASSIN